MSKERQELVDTVYSYRSYITHALAWNNHKRRTFKRVDWEFQKQAIAIGYDKHFDMVDNAINDNQQIADQISKLAIKKYNITEAELRASMLTKKPHSKIIESICHFTRDWTKLGDPELKPILDYVNNNIDKFIPNSETRERTLVLVPGSGLGRVAHELAVKSPSFANVQSIEFSPVMFLANEFIYTNESPTSYKLHPYIHTYSHHVTNEDHVRSVELKRHLKKPDNLKMNLADIRKFQVSDMDKYDTVLIVTAFFMDTAQNIFEYFEAIERLIGDKKGLWINIGPLKYGTAPQVEFSLEEFRKLRELRGWKDVDEPKPYGKEISGYLTDTQGLWQGYYGLGRWTSTFNRNRN